MLYKSFQLIKSEIDCNNYTLAEKLLEDIAGRSLTKASKSLYEALNFKVNQALKINSNNVPDNPKFSFAKLSEMDSQTIRPGISIVSCCMNRNDNLLKALRSWIKLPVDEIIIVDWSSTNHVSETIKEIEDPRIKVLRVEGELKWILTYGFNVGLRFTSYSKVYKFDADIEVAEDFLALNTISSSEFVRGYWKSALDEGLDSQVYVNGSFGAFKENLLNIGYYNELIRTYGWDDSDLYERLASQQGLRTKYLNFKSVLHMEQKESERTVNQDVITENFMGKIKSTEFNNQRNRFIGRTTEYWNVHRLQDYQISKVNDNLYTLKRLTDSIIIPNYLIQDANIYASMHFLWAHQYGLMKKSASTVDLAKFLYKEYQAEINFDVTLELLGETSFEHLVYCFDTSYDNYTSFIEQCINEAKTNQVNVYALSVSDSYAHNKIDFDNVSVEMLNVLDSDVNAILAQRTANAKKQKNNQLLFVSDEIFTETFNQYFKPKVYVDAQHGLGNRIRAIGSAAAIAKATGRELIIVWEADHHCECDFRDLFDYQGVVITSSFVDKAQKYMNVYNYMEIEDGAHKDKLITSNPSRHLYLRAAYTFNSPYSHWEAENKFIRELKPVAEIQKLIDGFDLTNTIAAHIRMEAGAGLDHNTYDSVENWTQDGHDQLHFWREKSHFSKFIKRIDEIFEQDSSIKLFLATDLPETYKIFQDYYGDKLVFLKRDVYDRSKEQIVFGLADAILLSRSQKLLGSTWSSFSELAMRLSTTYSSIEMSGRDF